MDDYTRKFSIVDDKDVEIYNILTTVYQALEEKGYTFLEANLSMVPQNYIVLEKEEDVTNMEKMIDALEDNDDIQNVYHNWQQD